MSLRYYGQTRFKNIKNKLKNVVYSPDINMSYNVITRKHDSEKIAETGTLFKGQQWDNKSGWEKTKYVKPVT